MALVYLFLYSPSPEYLAVCCSEAEIYPPYGGSRLDETDDRKIRIEMNYPAAPMSGIYASLRQATGYHVEIILTPQEAGNETLVRLWRIQLMKREYANEL